MDTVGLEAAARIGEGVTTIDPELVAGAGADAWRETGMQPSASRVNGTRRTALDLNVDTLGSRGPNAKMRAIWSNCRSEWWYWGSARHLPSVRIRYATGKCASASATPIESCAAISVPVKRSR